LGLWGRIGGPLGLRRLHHPHRLTPMKLPEHTVEITSKAAMKIIGDGHRVVGHVIHEQYRMTTYEANGVKIFSIFNFPSSRVAQYYIQDINA